MTEKVNILFVCLGNICRSPMAHAVMEVLIRKEQLSKNIAVDSAGLGSWHRGCLPDSRMIQHAEKHGYKLTHHARTVDPKDFVQFDYIFGMDMENTKHLKKLQEQYGKKSGTQQIWSIMDFAGNPENICTIPDPYSGTHEDFENVIELCELACPIVLHRIVELNFKS